MIENLINPILEVVFILLAISLSINFIIFYIVPFFILRKNNLIYRKFLRSRFPFFGLFPFPYFRTFTKRGFNREFNRIFFYDLIKETNDANLINTINLFRPISRLCSFFMALIFLIFIVGAFIAVILFIIIIILSGGKF